MKPLHYAAPVIFAVIIMAYAVWYVRALGSKRDVLWRLRIALLSLGLGVVVLMVATLPGH